MRRLQRWKYPDELTHIFARPRKTWGVRQQPDWMRKVRIGDVLETDNGRVQRIVRKVTFYSCGSLYGVTFTIKHCSWTHRCETSIDAGRLQTENWMPAGHRFRLNKPLDKAIALDLIDHHRRKVDCCDVRGIM